jgi:hypothetical protein
LLAVFVDFSQRPAKLRNAAEGLAKVVANSSCRVARADVTLDVTPVTRVVM